MAIDLKELDKRVKKMLDKTTPESFEMWLKKHRSNKQIYMTKEEIEEQVKEQVNTLKKEYDALKQELEEIKELMHPEASGLLPVEASEADKWIGENRGIWHYPYVSSRESNMSYPLAELMADFANNIIQKNK